MVALLMLYATAVGCLLAAAAAALDRLAASRSWPRRWIWVAAMAAMAVIPLLATPATPPQPMPAVATPHASASAPIPAPANASLSVRADISPGDRLLQPITAALASLGVFHAATALAMEAERQLAAARDYDGWLVLAWTAITALLLAWYGLIVLRLARARRAWPIANVDGETVRITPHTGPAVVGVWQPAIVLPAWVLAADSASRALVLRHERAHLRARDPLLLNLTTVFTYLIPWHVPLWWMLRRLRLAIELDCDQRVLRAGADVPGYAELLLAVGRRRSSRIGHACAPALVDSVSLLEQRILAMCPQRRRWQPLRFITAGGGAAMLVAVASLLPRPSLTGPADQDIPRPPSRIAPGFGIVALAFPLGDSASGQSFSLSLSREAPSPTAETSASALDVTGSDRAAGPDRAVGPDHAAGSDRAVGPDRAAGPDRSREVGMAAPPEVTASEATALPEIPNGSKLDSTLTTTRSTRSTTTYSVTTHSAATPSTTTPSAPATIHSAPSLSTSRQTKPGSAVAGRILRALKTGAFTVDKIVEQQLFVGQAHLTPLLVLASPSDSSATRQKLRGAVETLLAITGMVELSERGPRVKVVEKAPAPSSRPSADTVTWLLSQDVMTVGGDSLPITLYFEDTTSIQLRRDSIRVIPGAKGQPNRLSITLPPLDGTSRVSVRLSTE